MHRFKDNTFRLSVRDLVEFIYRSGDLSKKKSVKREQSMLAGTRIHQMIQRKQGSSYRAEVPFSISIPVDIEGTELSFDICIEGRADGIFTKDGLPAVDEIKGVYKQLEYINEPEQVHLAQAICYAYLDGIEDHLDRIIRMTYVNIDTVEEKYFYIPMTWEEIEKWFLGTIEKYKKWCVFSFTARSERNKSISALEFPYEYREGQRAIVATAYRSLKAGDTLYLQASTGIGKTLSTVFPAVRVMGEGRAERIFYLTAKTITAAVARSAFNILREHGLKASYINLTAKEKLCMMEEMNCDPDTCPYAKGYFDRVGDAVFDLITNVKTITREDITAYAIKHMVCPFEMSLDVTYWVDFIICDYNYVFDPNVRLQRFFGDNSNSDGLFLIDEAHNLVDRAREMISATLYKDAFLKAKKIIGDMDKRLKRAVEGCNRELLSLKKECDHFTVYEIGVYDRIFDRLFRLMEEFSRFYENNPQFYDKELSEFFFMCRDFLNLSDTCSYGYTAYGRLEDTGDFSVTLANADPSMHIVKCLEQGKGAVLFSATLLPIEYYRSLLTSDDENRAVYAQSPFDTSKRLLITAGDVTSKYSMRSEALYLRILDYIKKITCAKPGHYIVFFPSYQFMEKIYDLAGDISENIILQEKSMKEAEREEFLDRFNDEHSEMKIGFCVLGGIFSEGIDLKGKALIGVIVVGCGLPGVSPERNLLKDYFTEKGQDGFAYAYLYPGMGRVLQAAGRLIRTDDDEGVIALLDDRFLRYEYRRLFPREWSDVRSVRIDNLENELLSFWKSRDNNE